MVSLPLWLTSPLPYALLGILVLALAWRRLPRVLRWIGAIVVVALVAMMTPLGANALIGTLEDQVPPVTACKPPLPTTIVLLGGGTRSASRSPVDYESSSLRSLRRLFAAVKLLRQTPGAQLVISGGGRGVPESIRLAGLVEALGVPRSAITVETQSRTTWGNARYVSELKPLLPRHIWLVTSLADQPRALGAFRAWGFTPCAWPADPQYRSPTWRIGEFIPQDEGLYQADYAIHEYLGRVEYAWLEWRLRRSSANRNPPKRPGDQTS